jgi:predicted transcriptional regulator
MQYFTALNSILRHALILFYLFITQLYGGLLPSVYELAANGTVPAIRASLSVVLARKYGMRECSIAEALGITQAAVSKYLSGKYSSKIKSLQKSINKELLLKSAESIAADPSRAAKLVCDVCERMNGKKCYIRSR